MSERERQIIDHFQSITNWQNINEIHNYLDQYKWNLNNAMHDLLMDSNLHRGFNVEQVTTFCLCPPMHSKQKKFRSDEHVINEAYVSNDIERIKFRQIIDSNTFSFHGCFLHLLLVHMKSDSSSTKQDLLEYVNQNIIGKNFLVHGPWGPRRMIYADYTASGRSLKFIEDYIQNYVLPSYGNTHSENSLCSSQTTKFREEARELIKKSVHGKDDDVVIFTGTGSTGAIHKLVNILQLNKEENREKFVIFISAFEHHSNILPWKETGIQIIRIPYDNQGLLDQLILQQQLEYYHNQTNKQIICTFNAASNVTGILTDVDTISTLVHQYHGWIFWDYAAAAPYVKIDMNPSEISSKDAVFISTHKFVGGPGTPGILIGKKHLFQNPIPCSCGGGTVNFVTRTNVEYIHDIQVREEGGTPDILGSIRAGLVFQLKDAITYQIIEKREEELVNKFFHRLGHISTLIILGSSNVPRLAIFSFLIFVPQIRKYLHYNFICTLLNDLFGIQVRAGCACAGPYVLDLLGINEKTAHVYSMFLSEDSNARIDQENNQIERIVLMKPGFTRLNLSYFASEQEIDYILNAIEFLAYHAWKFLPFYTYDPVTGVWHYRKTFSNPYHSLKRIHYDHGEMEESNGHSMKQSLEIDFPNDCLSQAELILENIEKQEFDISNDPELNILDKYKRFIWFALPKDILSMNVNLFQKQISSTE